jgi:hypothetical protein
MRRPVSGRDAVRSQVIDVLEAQIKRRPAMKKVSTAAAKQSKNFSQQKLTIGLDLGNRNSWYCVVDEAGQIQLEQRVRMTAKALQGVFSVKDVGGMPSLTSHAHIARRRADRPNLFSPDSKRSGPAYFRLSFRRSDPSCDRRIFYDMHLATVRVAG